MKKPHNRSPTPTSRATSSSEALSGGNSRATARFLKFCPYRAISRPRLCPRVRGSIEATSILTQREASVVDVESQLERATRKKVGTTDEEVMDWLRRHEFTKKEGEAIMRTAKVEEG